MSEKQQTLKETIHISGVGLHSGQIVELKIHPAPENFWYQFRRTDIEDSPLIPAFAENMVDVSRGTTLEKDGVRVSTVEHVLSALRGMEVDNALIEVSSCEMPILDGSAGELAQAILKTGVVQQSAERIYFSISNEICYEEKGRGVRLSVTPHFEYTLTALIDYNSEVLQPQFAQINTFGPNFEKEVAGCRTFVFLHELEYLFNNNLIKGGNIDNAIVFVDRIIPKGELDKLAKLLNRPSVEVLSEGILNNVELKFKNEPARHKLLDLIGDLTLIGKPIKGNVVAHKPGHAANVEFAKLIRKKMLKAEQPDALPRIDLNAKPLYDINQVKGILPHRPPFLLVDKIMEMEENHVIGVKNVTVNEDFFRGHFPEKPVMPGVLLIEAMAQVGGIFILSKVEDPENYLTYFLKIDNVRFRQQVVPGDTVIFKLVPLSPMRRGLCHMKGWAFVGEQVVMEAELLAQISKIK